MNDAMMEERDRAMLVCAEWVTMEVRWNGGKREERSRARGRAAAAVVGPTARRRGRMAWV